MDATVAEAPPHRVVKSEAAFRTISEVAEDLDVPQHVLRFWESRFPQIKPLKRGGGRRYYRPADVQLLRRIRDLLYKDGYTIKGVQKLLRDGTLKAADAPSMPLPEPPEFGPADPDDDAADDIDDSEEPVAEAPAQPPAALAVEAPVESAPAGLSAVQKSELRAVLGDLKALRQILHKSAT